MLSSKRRKMQKIVRVTPIHRNSTISRGYFCEKAFLFTTAIHKSPQYVGLVVDVHWEALSILSERVVQQ